MIAHNDRSEVPVLGASADVGFMIQESLSAVVSQIVRDHEDFLHIWAWLGWRSGAWGLSALQVLACLCLHVTIRSTQHYPRVVNCVSLGNRLGSRSVEAPVTDRDSVGPPPAGRTR